MTFAQPAILAAGALLLILLAAFLRRADGRRIADLARFAAHTGSPARKAEAAAMRAGQRRWLGLGAALAILALSGPQVGSDWQETKRRGIDVLFALDVSRSMLAADVAPNRLARARLAILDFVDQLGGDRVGLIAFAGAAFLQSPLTLDHAAFTRTLAATTPAAIPRPGTDISSALEAAAHALESKKGNAKILVLLSDGEDLSGAAQAAARQAADAGIRVFTVGVGSRAGELIRISDIDGQPVYLKDEKGNLVRSALDESTLTQIAETTGGFYVPLGRHGGGMERIREEVLERIPKEELASRMRQKPRNRYQWPLAGALLCLLAEFLRQRRGTATAAITLLLVACAAPAFATEATGQAYYEAERWPEAALAFAAETGGEDAPTAFAIGAAHYRSAEYAAASRSFETALRSSDPTLRARSFYNLGNALFRQGEGTLEKEPEKTLAQWQRAVESYDGALESGPDEDAARNRELVARAREELERRLAAEPPSEPEPSPSPQPSPSPSGEPEPDSSDDDSNESKPSEQQDESGEEGENGDEDEEPSDDEASGDQEGHEDDSSSPEPDEASKTADATEAEQPGRMAPAEARALLDSLEGEERHLAIPLAEGEDEGQPGRAKVQDW
ncbi:MAG: VWA domain-containing protein [Deltaproteobacteria bacterium]